MRIEQLLQTTRGLQGPEREELLKNIERVKWFLWHGNVFRADETLNRLLEDIADVRENQRKAGLPTSVVFKKLAKAVDEFAAYVDNNTGAIVNYGKRYRCGERISTGSVESAVNQMIARRFVKKQQMHWTPRGAHLLLQVRTQVLNDELRASFERWYPRFDAQAQEPLAA
ncbi:hypothetical protein [Variovorax rhizosphaerae]|uniref:Uncharacterized protein n=1 Tax=Variovorax rhizosphaerae TaxID=1836200 RepID=A0ABU8WRJ0_9BURK